MDDGSVLFFFGFAAMSPRWARFHFAILDSAVLMPSGKSVEAVCVSTASRDKVAFLFFFTEPRFGQGGEN